MCLTLLPLLMKPTVEAVNKDVKARNKLAREKRKKRFDSVKPSNVQAIKIGDRVLVKQQKSSIKPTFDLKPYTVTKVNTIQVTSRKIREK